MTRAGLNILLKPIKMVYIKKYQPFAPNQLAEPITERTRNKTKRPHGNKDAINVDPFIGTEVKRHLYCTPSVGGSGDLYSSGTLARFSLSTWAAVTWNTAWTLAVVEDGRPPAGHSRRRREHAGGVAVGACGTAQHWNSRHNLCVAAFSQGTRGTMT